MLLRQIFYLPTLIHYATLMRYNSNCHCQVTDLDLDETPMQLAEPEPFHFFECIDLLLNETEKPLEDHVRDACNM
jgi:hypothetical protein